MKTQIGVHHHPARILSSALGASSAETSKSLRAQILRTRFLDGDFEGDDVPDLFLFDAAISNDRLDAYYTRMATSSLANYAKDAKDGVSFQNSHNWDELGFGRSYDGVFTPGSGSESDPDRVVASFYTVPGLRLNDVSTDDLIKGIKTGLISDVSIGFASAEFTCNICGRDILWDYDCEHIPGVSYKSDGGDTDTLCFAWVENARLLEVSAVYKGATPGASILKAGEEAKRGRLPDLARAFIEQRYRVQLPDPVRVHPVSVPGDGAGMSYQGVASASGVTIPAVNPGNTPESKPLPREGTAIKEDITMSLRSQVTFDDGIATVDADVMETLLDAYEQPRRVLTEAEEEAIDHYQELVEQNKNAAQEIETLRATVEQLTPLAAVGEQYRQDKIESAIQQGVRALGDAFNEDVYRGVFAGLETSAIDAIGVDFARVAKGVFESGRLSNDENEPTPPNPQKQDASLAYMGA